MRMRISERPVRKFDWSIPGSRRSNHTPTERKVLRSFVETERRRSAISSLSRVIAGWRTLRNCYFSKSIRFERRFVRRFIDRIQIGLFQRKSALFPSLSWSQDLVIKR